MPLTIRSVSLANRVAISPMCQYSAVDGVVQPWHMVHLGAFATGGAGLVFVEASGVEARGRITHGCVGLWNRAQADALAPIAAFLKSQGTVPAIQIAHAGRKGSASRPWDGNMSLGPEDKRLRGEDPWETIAPSAVPVGDGWAVPRAMSVDDIETVQAAFVESARLALAAGFEVLEVHGAHGYLINSFLSPIANQRNDGYGGDLDGRMRFALETVARVRAVWPADKPLFMRISATDHVEGGWTVDDSVVLARQVKELGVDVIDCSSGGIGGSVSGSRLKRDRGWQLPYARRIREEAGIATMGVGMIITGADANDAIADGTADLIAIGREALVDPAWARHAAWDLGADPGFDMAPTQYKWSLKIREPQMAR